tara:strand:+ start:109 stop:462 length:354 start_codon:yes stop_codon:yes gene_type:complete
MNERIKELIFETDEWLESNAQSDRWEREIKFAELIVRECLNQCYNRGMDNERYAGQLQAASYIEQHFGVSESSPRLDTMVATNPHTQPPGVLTNISEGIYPNRFGYIFYPPAGKEPK